MSVLGRSSTPYPAEAAGPAGYERSKKLKPGASPGLGAVKRSSSECDLGAHGKSVEARSSVDGAGRTGLPGDVAMQVVEQEAHDDVDVPVQGRGVDVLPSTGDAGSGCDLIVQVDRADTPGDFPGSPAARLPRERMGGFDAAIRRA